MIFDSSPDEVDDEDEETPMTKDFPALFSF
jgi:hypothetical protein